MVKIPVLLTSLLQLLWMLITVSGQSPCPPTFTYFRSNVTHKIMGKIWIPYPPKDQVEYNLTVDMSTGYFRIRNPPGYPGEIKLEKSAKDTIQDIQDDKPLVYIVHFPIQEPLPQPTKIKFNGYEICKYNTLYSDEGLVFLEHFLFFYNNTWKWLESTSSAMGARGSKMASNFEYGGGLEPPTDGPIFDVIPPITSATQASTWKPSMHNPITGDISGCGRNADLVVPLIANGVEVSRGEWPWVVALFVARRKLEYQCVGSILTNRHVITAAHCMRLKDMDSNLPPSALYASLGRNRLREWREEGSVNVQVLNYTIHPDYAYNESADSDLAILFLWRSVEFSPTIKPICLWTGPTDLEGVVRKIGNVVGWGRDESGRQSLEELRMANVPIVSQTECFWSDPHFVTFTSGRTFCAGSQDGSGPCNGDSGSGLMLYDSTTDRYYIRGVASRSLVNHSTRACDLNHFVVFVDVAKYTDWIREQISTD